MSVAKDFEKLLKSFFEFYHPRQVTKVGRIVQEFKGQEILLLKVLCDKYKKAYTVVPGLNEELKELYADAPELESINEDSKDKLTEEENQEAEQIVALEEEKIEEVVVVPETEEEEEEK